jgi:hypothetical protein
VNRWGKNPDSLLHPENVKEAVRLFWFGQAHFFLFNLLVLFNPTNALSNLVKWKRLMFASRTSRNRYFFIYSVDVFVATGMGANAQMYSHFCPHVVWTYFSFNNTPWT